MTAPTGEWRGAVLIPIHEDSLPPDRLGPPATGVPLDEPAPTRTSFHAEYGLTREGCSIGRDPACGVRVSEHRVDISRRHATISWEEGAYVLHDHSMHGTFVNGQRLTSACRLAHGDVIGLAHSQAMFRFEEPGTDAASMALTDREREVLALLEMGYSQKEIAEQLMISQHTVSSHLKHIYGKLGVSNGREAVNLARKRRLL